MGSRSRQAIFGFITDLGGNVLLSVVGIVTVPIFLRLTSESQYGFWMTALSILAYLALIDLGIGISLTRLVAGLTDEKESEALNRLVSSAFFVLCVSGFLLLAVGATISLFIPGWFKITPLEAPSIVHAYLIAVLAGAIAIPLSIFGIIIIGFQRMAVENTVRNLVSLFAVGVSLALLFSGWRIIALALSMLFTFAVTGLINALYVRRLCPNLRINFTLVNRTDLIRLLKFGGYFQLTRIAGTVTNSTDNIIVATAMGAAMVNPYAFTSKLPVLFSINIASKLGIAAFPALSHMFALNQTLQLQRAFILLVHYATRLAAVGSVFVAIVNYKFVSLWVGAPYYGGSLLNAIFVCWILQNTIYHIMPVIVYSSGEIRKWVMVSLSESVINLGISILLVGPLGFAGVALGTLIGKTSTTAWYTPYWICRRLNLPIRHFVLKGLLTPALRCLPGVGLTVLMAYVLPTNLNWTWIIMVGLVAVFINILSFEGIEFVKLSNLPWRKRVDKLLTFGMTEV